MNVVYYQISDRSQKFQLILDLIRFKLVFDESLKNLFSIEKNKT